MTVTPGSTAPLHAENVPLFYTSGTLKLPIWNSVAMGEPYLHILIEQVIDFGANPPPYGWWVVKWGSFLMSPLIEMQNMPCPYDAFDRSGNPITPISRLNWTAASETLYKPIVKGTPYSSTGFLASGTPPRRLINMTLNGFVGYNLPAVDVRIANVLYTTNSDYYDYTIPPDPANSWQLWAWVDNNITVSKTGTVPEGYSYATGTVPFLHLADVVSTGLTSAQSIATISWDNLIDEIVLA